MSERAVGGTTVQRMRGLDVRYISLCGAGKNGRTIIAKGELPEGAEIVEKSIAIRKSDAAKRMVYGVVYAPESVDADGHVASAGEIEKAMHGFMQQARVGQVDTNHDEQVGVGYVAESWLVKADEDGVVVDALFPEEPAGTWAVGIKVADDASWAMVEKGELGGLSLAGVATLEAEAVAKSEGSEASEAESVATSFVAKVKSLLGLVDDGPEAVAVAEVAGSDAAGYELKGLITRGTGAASVAFVGSPAVAVLGESDAAWDCALVANTSLGGLDVQVTGAAATTVRWVAVIEWAEVEA